MYESLGFVHEGRRREHLWFDGKYHDEIEMGILRDEWKEKLGRDSEKIVTAGAAEAEEF